MHREGKVAAQHKSYTGSLISFTFLSFKNLTLDHFTASAWSSLQGLLGQKTDLVFVPPIMSKQAKKTLDKN